MLPRSRILVIDDDRYDNDRYCQALRSANYDVQGLTNVDEALQIIQTQSFEVVLLDMLLPVRLQGRTDFGGLILLRHIKERDPTAQVIAVTGYGSRELAAEAMAMGALDYIIKDPDTEDRLPGSVRVAIARCYDLRSPQTSETVFTTPQYLIANSEVMRQVLRRTQRLAGMDGSVLVTGEPGVGKELIASILHVNSRYASGPFKVLLCRNLSPNLVELWGDAAQPSSGLCQQTEGGTLVLKGIEGLPFDQQEQLVRLIERGKYHPVDAHWPVSCHLRVIATTTADLERLVRQGRFFRPLHEALGLATLRVPPLRDRRDDDIMAIAGYLLHRNGINAEIGPAAAEQLVKHDYAKGNIKELEEILQIAARHAVGNLIQSDDVLAAFSQASTQTAPLKPLFTTASVEVTIRFAPGKNRLLIWESRPGTNTYSRLKLPFAQVDLPTILRALDAVQWPGHPSSGPQFTSDEQARLAKLGLWQDGRAAPDVGRRVGQLLYKALISDPRARSALEGARNAAIDKSLPLILTLRFPSKTLDLAMLPWELLWDERQPLLLSRTKPTSCVRYIEIDQAVPAPPTMNKQLRLLAVSPRAGIPDRLHAEEHAARITALQPLIDEDTLIVEELRPVSVRTLTDRLLYGEPVDVLHFYGHGIWKHGKAHLQLDDVLLGADQLAMLLGNIPLVVLYACRSGTLGNDNLFAGIAPTLSTEGVAVVIAMQFTMSVDAANRFSSVLYRSVGKGESLQVAVAKARQALYAEYPESWYVPVLYIRSQMPGK